MEAGIEAVKIKWTIDDSTDRSVTILGLHFTEWLPHSAGFQRKELLTTIRLRDDHNHVHAGPIDEKSAEESMTKRRRKMVRTRKWREHKATQIYEMLRTSTLDLICIPERIRYR